MDPRHIKHQINELKYRISTCKDEMSLIVLQDILLKKQRTLAMFNKMQEDEEKVENALEVLMEQKEEEEEEAEAYQRILNDNIREKQKERHDRENNRKWNKRADPKYAREVEKDFANNKLMERMNSELDFRIHGPDKSHMSKAFSQDDEDNGDYVSVKKFKKYGIPSDNFSSKRMLGRRKDI